MIAHADWTSIGTFVVAGATLVLAFATLRLARRAGDEIRVVTREAEATERQAELSARALQASIRPWLTAATERDVDPYASINVTEVDGGGVTGFISIKNVGNGLAVIPKNRSWVWGRDGAERAFSKNAYALPRASVLAPSDSTAVEFDVKWVQYSDFTGSNYGNYFQVMSYIQMRMKDKAWSPPSTYRRTTSIIRPFLRLNTDLSRMFRRSPSRTCLKRRFHSQR